MKPAHDRRDGDSAWPWDAIDHSGAAALIAGHLPAADHTPLEPFGQGVFCLAYRHGPRVVRVARHAEAAAALRREACVLDRIAPLLPLPVPRPTYHAPDGCPPFAVHDEVAGEALTRQRWLSMPADARENAAAELANFLRALHSLTTGSGVACGLEKLDATELARRLRGSMHDTIGGLFDRETRARLDAALERWSYSAPQSDSQPVLLHGDIGPAHVLYSEETGRLTGVIDFGDVAIGDAARDFIFMYEDYGEEIHSAVLRRYAGDDAPSMLAEIQKWYVLEAVAWTVEMHAARRDADVEQGIDEISRELARPRPSFSRGAV
ncbi:MAG TPA: phosphotransferase [Gemmatimonadaceae bacterium]|nr:phosphotransferase [Gemmatimonadaceae bacterium]